MLYLALQPAIFGLKLSFNHFSVFSLSIFFLLLFATKFRIPFLFGIIFDKVHLQSGETNNLIEIILIVIIMIIIILIMIITVMIIILMIIFFAGSMSLRCHSRSIIKPGTSPLLIEFFFFIRVIFQYQYFCSYHYFFLLVR